MHSRHFQHVGWGSGQETEDRQASHAESRGHFTMEEEKRRNMDRPINYYVVINDGWSHRGEEWMNAARVMYNE